MRITLKRMSESIASMSITRNITKAEQITTEKRKTANAT